MAPVALLADLRLLLLLHGHGQDLGLLLGPHSVLVLQPVGRLQVTMLLCAIRLVLEFIYLALLKLL